eukprot:jgi/Botrbrau1/22923/Bobra.0030s0002.2
MATSSVGWVKGSPSEPGTSSACGAMSGISCGSTLTTLPTQEEFEKDMVIQAAPFSCYNNGAPKAPNETARARTAAEINQFRVQHEPEFDCMLRVLCTVFKTDTAFISVITGDTIRLANGCGMVGAGMCPPQRLGLCGWSFLTPCNQLLVVENTLQDARFSESEYSTGEMLNIVFYAAAPLITSTGHRIGTLCIAADEPRKLDDQGAMILANMAELVVRKLEKQWALHLAKQEEAAGRTALMRSIDCYERGYLFVDTGVQPWRVLHMNQPACEQTGFKFEDPLDLQDVFFEKTSGVLKISEGCMDRAAAAKAFVLSHMGVKGQCGSPSSNQSTNMELELDSLSDAMRSTSISTDSSSRGPKLGFNLVFKPAASDVIDEDAAHIGVPSFCATGTTDLGTRYYFVEVQTAKRAGTMGGFSGSSEASSPISGSSASSSSGSTTFKPEQVPIPGLALGTLLGKGGYGRVYRGIYRGEQVAVKIIERLSTSHFMDGLPLEATVAAKVDHPGIVKTLAHEIEVVTPSSSRGKKGTSQSTVVAWLITEFCDKGTLADAVIKGWLMTTRSPLTGRTDWGAAMSVSRDIASGMAELHSHGVAHGDLSAGNVLLQSCSERPYGFAAKIADFGLARQMDIQSRISTDSYGTVSYLAPETFTQGIIGKAADVYAFGVVMWEVVSHTRAWAGMLHAQIMFAVAMRRRKLEFPEGTHAGYAELALDCMAFEPEDRPTFPEIVKRLDKLMAAHEA